MCVCVSRERTGLLGSVCEVISLFGSQVHLEVRKGRLTDVCLEDVEESVDQVCLAVLHEEVLMTESDLITKTVKPEHIEENREFYHSKSFPDIFWLFY